MRLVVLVDNYVINDSYGLGEPALSFYIESLGMRILFDFGETDAYLKNARRKGVDLGEIDTAVLSHGHSDHTGGIGPFIEAFKPRQRDSRVRLVYHPTALLPKRYGSLDIGLGVPVEILRENFNLVPTLDPFWLNDELVYLGEIERGNGFENKKPLGQRYEGEGFVDDFLPDDSALVHVGDRHIDIITGCSHSGICNIIEYAKKVTGKQRVGSVIGGFHLNKTDPELVDATASYFREADIEQVYPCHCTDTFAKIALAAASPVEEAGVGLVLEL